MLALSVLLVLESDDGREDQTNILDIKQVHESAA